MSTEPVEQSQAQSTPAVEPQTLPKPPASTMVRRLQFLSGILAVFIITLGMFWLLRFGLRRDMSASLDAQGQAYASFEKAVSAQIAEQSRLVGALKDSYDQIQKNTRSDHEAVDQYLRRSVSPGALEQVVASVRDLQASVASLKSEIANQSREKAAADQKVAEMHAYLSEQLYPVLITLQTKVAALEAEISKGQQGAHEPAITGVSIAPEEPTKGPKSSDITVQPGATMPSRLTGAK